MNTCCEHHQVNCNQGRLCPDRIDMESAVLGARFNDGGHMVNGEDSQRISLDPPLTTPEECGVWCVAAQVFLAAVFVAMASVAFLHAYRYFNPA